MQLPEWGRNKEREKTEPDIRVCDDLHLPRGNRSLSRSPYQLTNANIPCDGAVSFSKGKKRASGLHVPGPSTKSLSGAKYSDMWVGQSGLARGLRTGPRVRIELGPALPLLAKINQRSGEAAPSDLAPEHEPRCQVPRSRKGAEQAHKERELSEGVVLDTCHFRYHSLSCLLHFLLSAARDCLPLSSVLFSIILFDWFLVDSRDTARPAIKPPA